MDGFFSSFGLPLRSSTRTEASSTPSFSQQVFNNLSFGQQKPGFAQVFLGSFCSTTMGFCIFVSFFVCLVFVVFGFRQILEINHVFFVKHPGISILLSIRF